MTLNITQSQKRLLIILGIVLVYFIYDLISNMNTYKNIYLGSEDSSVVADSVDSLGRQANLGENQKQKEYLNKWGESPFYVFSATTKKYIRKNGRRVAVKKNPLQLLAISLRKNRSVALINDKIVKVGDIISGYQVERIDKRTVYLSNGKKKIKLVLKPY